MDKERKAIFVLAIAGILALGFGFWQLRHNIRAPFLLNPLKAKQEAETTWIDMQNKDTDSDGLSDYDETYLYATSPYLEDSDSDGKLDGEEIQEGTDPNCPEGKDCKTTAGKPATSAGLALPGTEASQAGDTQSAEDIDLTNLSINDIREILKASGIDEESLKKLDDKALKEIYDEALKATQ
ncbi:hypothetical protein KJ885_02085 [Patescibacteria group bacterium]|nr:hypothetical protein [Patescibacteria group bacterium]